ncbi:MAG: hypothetical protein ACPIOQ_15660 [Promethearchaeia archaeon]
MNAGETTLRGPYQDITDIRLLGLASATARAFTDHSAATPPRLLVLISPAQATAVRRRRLFTPSPS